MKRTLRIIAVSVVVALLNAGVSFAGDVNLVWIASVSVFVAEMEGMGIMIAVLAGFISDMLLHEGLGTTGLVILFVLVLYVAARSVGICHRTWQKILLLFLMTFVAYLTEYLMKSLSGEGTGLSLSAVYYCAGRTLPNAVLSTVVYGIIVFWVEQHPERAVVKL